MRFLTCLLAVLFLCPSFSGADDAKTEKWDNGKVREKSYYDDATGDLEKRMWYRRDGSLEKSIQYDPDGNKVSEANYGEDGKLEENADGWAAMRWKYDDGNMTAEGYYGEDGKLSERKQYNSVGDIVAKQYYGDDGRILPAEEYNPDPTLAGESNSYYDKFGRSEGTTSVELDDDQFPFMWPYED